LKKILLIIIFFLIALSDTARAQIIIRDTEIENYLKDYSKGIFVSAGLNADSVKIILLQDNSPNAFVAGGMNIFINTGLIDLTDSPEELIGVIAHETGHISAGHLSRVGEEIANAKMNSLYALLLATVVGVGVGSSEAGVGILAGANETNNRSFLHYSRIQEGVADQIALRCLDENKISAEGFSSFLNKLEEQSLLPSSAQAEYLNTHPLSTSRIKAIKDHIENTNINNIEKLNDYKFKIIKEKIKGYIYPRRTIFQYKDTNDLDKLYALSIAQYRIGELKNAIDNINKLINKENNNPFLYEIKGQMLRKNGNIKESIISYKKADSMIFSPLIKIEYARVMLESGDNNYLDLIISNLNQALQYEGQSVNTWQLLANAYERSGNESLFRLSQAEADFLNYDFSKAKFNAKKAKDIFEKEKKACQRCTDIVEFIESKESSKK
jgi:predicted Zn-dependent protease